MRTFLTISAAAAALVSATAASAQTIAPDEAQETGFYLGVAGGIASADNTRIQYYDVGGTFNGAGATDTADATLDLASSGEVRGVIGYDFGRFRGDVEISYARNRNQALTIDKLNGTAVTLSASDAADVCSYLEVGTCSVNGNTVSFANGGRVRQLSALANVWVDFPIGKTFTPYVGGGIGATGFELDGEGKAGFAWQLGGGVAVHVAKHVAITADFRHRDAKGAKLPYDAVSGFTVGRMRTNSFSAGLRFTF